MNLRYQIFFHSKLFLQKIEITHISNLESFV